jgi:hypothetical protein
MRPPRRRSPGLADGPRARTAPRVRWESTDHRAWDERSDPAEANDPIESREPADPTEPTERTEPTEPIERSDPADAIESRESVEATDHRDRLGRRRSGGEPDTAQVYRSSPS